jgi:hypothetical protein
MIPGIAIESLHAASPSGYFKSALYLTLYFAVWLLLLLAFYKKEGKRNRVLIGINAALSVWSIAVGAILMVMAKG